MSQDPLRILVSQSTLDVITEAAIRQGYIPSQLPCWNQMEVVAPVPNVVEAWDRIWQEARKVRRPGHLRHHTINPAAYVGDYGLPPWLPERSTNATGA
jgi:hypothetical protein